MTNYREILRLSSLGYSQRQIEASAGCSRHTISEVTALAKCYGISWPLDDSVTNEMLAAMFHPAQQDTDNPRQEPDCFYIHTELAKPGVNLTLLWTEYCEAAHAAGKIPYMYTQFCVKYRKWARLTKATMRIHHKPGDAMEVDWAGDTLPLYDKYTGDTTEISLFVAVLPCSCKTYAEACRKRDTETWIACHVHAYSYFGGVTRLLIPDNLKTGIISNTRYDTIFNRSYAEMAEYYDTAIYPCRVNSPQDKSHAEGSVKYASTWILAALRNRKFFTMQELSEAVSEKLEELNEYPFHKRVGNRNTAYLDEEQEFMKPLPITPFEPAVWSTAKVQNDYLISDGKNKYSVPYDLIGEQVDIRLTKGTVEIFFHGSRVASHPRLEKAQRDPIVLPQHMPPEHRKYLKYDADEFRRWAFDIGPKAEVVINSFLTSGKEPEQGFKYCVSLTKLSEKYGKKRLEAACEHALCYTSSPTLRSISSILKNGQDKIPVNDQPEEPVQSHGITRGASYYRRGGTHNAE